MSESMIQMQRKLADVTAMLEKAEAEVVKWRTACHAGKKQVEGLQATLAKLREQKPVAWFMFDKKGVMVVTTNPYTASYRWARYSVYKLFSAHVPEQREGKLAVAAKQSQSDSLVVLEEWCDKLLAEFPLLDDEGLCQEKHHCEWTLQQDRKRLHTLLQPAPTGEPK